jgi:hypothetical protein
MKKYIRIGFSRCVEWLTSLKKKLMSDLQSREKFTTIIAELTENLKKDKVLQVKHGEGYHTVRSIHLTCKKPYLVLEDELDTRIDLDKIKDVKWV